MKRREFITLISGAAAWPLATRAQQRTTPVIGFLSRGSVDSLANLIVAFRRGLQESGFTEGQNVAMDFRWAGSQSDSLPAIIADFTARRVSVIIAFGDVFAQAAKAATTTVPIVFVGGNDPVSIGLVASLNRPGGNVTGVTLLNVEIAAKRLQVMNELIPTASNIAVLLDRATLNFEIDSKNLTEAAKRLGLQVNMLQATNPHEIELALGTVAQQRLGPLVIGPSSLFNVQSQQLAALAVHHALPAIFQTREFVAAGGLMSYGGSLVDAARIAGTYTGRILSGEKPADLPVQQVAKVEFIINLKTAKALGITVPLSLLGRADDVIE
jgi:putative ABC transport system substrate-binding protein